MRIKLFIHAWSNKKHDLKQWMYYNVLLALSPIWLSWLFLMFGGVFSQFLNPFFDGTLLMFAATLSGASMSFFVTDTEVNLPKTERFIFNGLLVTIIVGACGYTAIVILKQFSSTPLNRPVITLVTYLTVLLAVYLNLYLVGVRSLYMNTSSIDQFIKEEKEDSAAERKALSDKAHAANNADGADL
ncbi:MAG TPA: hypothetical protein VGB77_19590 [Abditibacteriaceae bacterium]|jgi:hypothetical protein